MTTAAVPSPQPSEIQRSGPAVAAQVLLSGSLIAGAITLVASGRSTRALEARWMAPVFDLMTPGDTLVVGDRLYDNVHTGAEVTGLQMSVMCSVVILAAPLLVQGALMVASGRFNPLRVLGALCVSLPMVFLVNSVRIGTIGWARAAWGDAGFEVSHHLVAALLALVGFAAAVVVQLRLSVSPDRR